MAVGEWGLKEVPPKTQNQNGSWEGHIGLPGLCVEGKRWGEGWESWGREKTGRGREELEWDLGGRDYSDKGEGWEEGVLQNSFQKGPVGLCYRPLKGPFANNQGLATLPIEDHTHLHPGGQVGSCFSPRQDISNLIWVAGLTEGNINN